MTVLCAFSEVDNFVNCTCIEGACNEELVPRFAFQENSLVEFDVLLLFLAI